MDTIFPYFDTTLVKIQAIPEMLLDGQCIMMGFSYIKETFLLNYPINKLNQSLDGKWPQLGHYDVIYKSFDVVVMDPCYLSNTRITKIAQCLWMDKTRAFVTSNCQTSLSLSFKLSKLVPIKTD